MPTINGKEEEEGPKMAGTSFIESVIASWESLAGNFPEAKATELNAS